MIDSDKIVAAILAAAHSAKNAMVENAREFVDVYNEMLEEIKKQ
jgi:hypothetical protein